MELSCRLEGHSVHVLGYLFDPRNDELAGEMARDQGEPAHRARAMVDKLAKLGAPVTWEQVSEIAGGGVVGRPHIARALVAAGVVPTPADAFSPEWIGPGGRAHVSRYALDPVRAVRLVRAAGGVTVLAHPRGDARGWQIPDEVIEELAAAGLTGLEVNHPQQDRAVRARLRALAAALGPGRLGRKRRPRRADRLPDRHRDRARRQLPAARRAGDRGRAAVPALAGLSRRTIVLHSSG